MKFESGELSDLSASTHSAYSLQYLGELTKLAGDSPTKSLEFEEKYPLRLTWMSNDGGANGLTSLHKDIMTTIELINHCPSGFYAK